MKLNINKFKTNHLIIIGISLVCLIAMAGISFSYAMWQANYEQEEPNVINTACFNLLFEEQSASINLDNSYPMSDIEGMKTIPYNFSVKNECGTQAKYMITIDIMNATTMDLSKIKVYLEGGIDKQVLTTLDSIESNEDGVRISYILNEDYITEGIEHKYSLRVWIDESAEKEEMEKIFEGRVTLTATQNDEVLTNNFVYTGGMQEFVVPRDGYYEVELWGAGSSRATNTNGGYSKGTIYLEKDEILYLYIGGTGGAINSGCTTTTSPGWNGGGTSGIRSTTVCGAGGSGATDVRLVKASETATVWNSAESLRSRIMVAAGAGGIASQLSTRYELVGHGGGLIGQTNSVPATTSDAYQGKGGTQIAGGAAPTHYTADANTTNGAAGSFGVGGAGGKNSTTSANGGGGAGGGGYFGGSGGSGISSGSFGGGGGSSYISGYSGVNSITSASSSTLTYNTNHYSNKYFINGVMETGKNNGNGKASIKYTRSIRPTKTTTKLDNVRYIKSCINGSSANTSNHWVELQAIVNGVNIAKGKTVTGTVIANTNYPYTRFVDGDISSGSSAYTLASAAGKQCITVDLGNIYDLDEVVLWNYYVDQRTYYENTLSVGTNNLGGTVPLETILHTYSGTNGFASTSQGKRYTAWDIE